MTSHWKYLCCGCCDIADDKRARSSARYKHHKSNKNTWTRRKLLEGDDDTHFINGDPRAYQMRTINDTPVRELDDENEDAFEERILDYYAPKKRPTIHNVFDTTNENNTHVTNKTTFPWMDDRFVPPERSRTRLGISSVQINAKRNDVRNNLVNANVTTNRHIDDAVKNNVSEQQNRGMKQIFRNNYQLLNTHSNQTNVKENGYVIKNNIVTAPTLTPTNKPNHVCHVVSINNGNKPMVFKESSSDVGVRRITPSTHQTRTNIIPKLENYRNVNGTRYFKDTSSDIGPYRPKSHTAFHNASGSNEGDVSFSSEVTFRQNPSSDLSMKRSSAPKIFSSQEAKYERIKSGKNKHNSKHDQSMNESMYGYIPKAVQDVQASNALEGAPIDDFFMKLFHERQMDKFGLLENAENTEEDNVPVIVTTVGSVEDLTKDKASHTSSVVHTRSVKQDGGSRAKYTSSADIDSESIANRSNSSDIASKSIEKHSSSGKIESQLKGQNIPPLDSGSRNQEPIVGNADRGNELNTKHSDVKSTGSAQKSDLVNKSGDKTDTSADKVIMIDFPPNPDIDRKVVARNVKLNQTKLPPPTANLAKLKLTENNVITKVDEVLY